MVFQQAKLAASIEGTTVRTMAYRRQTVLSWTEIELPAHLFRNGFLIDARGFVQAVRGDEKGAGLPAGKAVAALPGLQHFMRITRVPREARKDLHALVKGEVRRAMPDAERNLFVYWQCIGPSSALQQTVYVLAVPRQPLITTLEALKGARLNPVSLDLRPMALARAVNKQHAIIGNAESRGLDVVVVRDDIPVMMRSLHLGEDYDAIEYVNGRLAEELARTVQHFNATSADGPLAPDTPVYLTGRGARDPNLASAVEELTQHAVHPFEPPVDCPADFPAVDFAVHIGLMLK